MPDLAREWSTLPWSRRDNVSEQMIQRIKEHREFETTLLRHQVNQPRNLPSKIAIFLMWTLTLGRKYSAATLTLNGRCSVYDMEVLGRIVVIEAQALTDVCILHLERKCNLILYDSREPI